jgi:hypothetical protein
VGSDIDTTARAIGLTRQAVAPAVLRRSRTDLVPCFQGHPQICPDASVSGRTRMHIRTIDSLLRHSGRCRLHGRLSREEVCSKVTGDVGGSGSRSPSLQPARPGSWVVLSHKSGGGINRRVALSVPRVCVRCADHSLQSEPCQGSGQSAGAHPRQRHHLRPLWQG